MARTDSTAVEGILLDHYKTGDSLVGFIATANSVVTKVAACVTRKGGSMSEGDKELMERWLSAFFYSLENQPYAQEKTMDSSARYQGQWGEMLTTNNFGKGALMLDDYGCLQALAKKKRVGLTWLGKAKSAQIDYHLRD